MTNIDKIKAEIERLKGKGKYHGECGRAYCDGNNSVCQALLSFLDTLEQEPVDLDFQYFAKEMDNIFALSSSKTKNTEEEPLNWEYAIARHFYSLGRNARKDELPEIELNKFADKVNTFKARYKHPESISINGAMAFMARMFYQYPNAARLWYEQLPKATMD